MLCHIQKHNMSEPIENLSEFVDKVADLDITEGRSLFFRGHANQEYRIQPSLFRNEGYMRNERRMVKEVISENPGDFKSDENIFDKLVRMQHFNLPTRLLDLTSNPMAALWFACEHTEVNGEVIIFDVPDNIIKHFDSDSTFILSSLARIKEKDKTKIRYLLETERDDSFSENWTIEKMLHKIKDEKPHFPDYVDPDLLDGATFVKPKMNNVRIKSQSGLFILFGMLKEIDKEGYKDVKISSIAVDKNKKLKIKNTLDMININEKTLFPFIEKTANYISRKYIS